MPEALKINIGNNESVTALIYSAEGRKPLKTTVLLGHGAGANQTSDFMVTFAAGLAARGADVATFNFPYMEQGRRAPDRNDKLEACYRAAIGAIRNHSKRNRLVIGGKSLGGRIASQVAAGGVDDLAGLLFLGYPLHPPGKPEQLRAEHLARIHAPMLFVQGGRDPFGTPEELRPVIEKLNSRATLYVVEGGDHSLAVPKKWPVSQEAVYAAALDEIARWLSRL
ncbi:MAG TPA: alpha/beta fold hydrolase [Blastocatellia bacterium]|nr:alpha/beta fold hydrolase [Blastocatellia bacterium]